MSVTYASLTPQQQAQLAAYDTLIRPALGELARVLGRMKAINNQYNANVSAILSSLTGTETVPNSTALAGAIDVTASEQITWTSYLQNLLANWGDDAHLQEYTKAAGAANTISSN